MSNSAVTYIYEETLKFRAPGEAAVTADTVNSVPLDKLVNARSGSQRNTLGAEAYDIPVVVSAVDTSGDGEYVFNVYAGATGDGAGGTLVASLTVTKAGMYVISATSDTIENLDDDYEEITLQADVTGTAPSVTYSAWLANGG